MSSPAEDLEPMFASVIVPTRDRFDLLRDCLGSLCQQDYPSERYEIIVVDDGLEGRTSSLVEAFQLSSTPSISLVTLGGAGPNAARNAGISLAMGDPICFVDDDVLVPPVWLSAMVRGVNRYKDAGCLSGPIRLKLDGKSPRLCGREPLGEHEQDFGTVDCDISQACGANMTIRSWAVDRVGTFNEALPIYADEFEWQWRLLADGGRIAYVADAWLWHCKSANTLRIRSLIRNRFKRGRNKIELDRLVGTEPLVRNEMAPMLRAFGHAVRRQCTWGVLMASERAGRAWGASRAR